MDYLKTVKILSEDSMLYFENIEAFKTFYKDFNLYSDWRVLTGTLNDRGKKIENKPYAKTLVKLFEERSMFRRKLSIAELTSFMDNFFFISRLLELLKKKLTDETLGKIKLVSEYKIKMSKNRRIDYILCLNNKLLLIEFRLSNDFPNTSNMWQKKELELIIYKELLCNYVSNQIKVLVYAFIGMPEFDGNTPILKHQKYNEENLEYLAEYIRLFMT